MGNLITTPKVNVNDYDTFDQQRIKINNGLNDFDNFNALHPYIYSVAFTTINDDEISILTPGCVMNYDNSPDPAGTTFNLTYNTTQNYYSMTRGGSAYGSYGIAAQGMSFQVDNRGGSTYRWRITSTNFVVQFMTAGGVIKTHTYLVSSAASPLSYVSSYASIDVGSYGLYINALRGAAGLNAVSVVGRQGLSNTNSERAPTAFSPAFSTLAIT